MQISLSDSLVRVALQQVRQWMADYPYACRLEQKASKLVVAGDSAGWAALMAELPRYLDPKGLARYFNEGSLSGSETLTAYLLDLSAAQKWIIPADSRNKMLAALQQALPQKSSRKTGSRSPLAPATRRVAWPCRPPLPPMADLAKPVRWQCNPMTSASCPHALAGRLGTHPARAARHAGYRC